MVNSSRHHLATLGRLPRKANAAQREVDSIKAGMHSACFGNLHRIVLEIIALSVWHA
jgi:hypothetical protein